jgi:SAM-dependent methyltransferase
MTAGLESSRAFWNSKAAENPYWYVSSFRDYGDPDPAGFWESGRYIWSELKAALALPPSRGAVAVEVGCGLGRLSRAMAGDFECVHAFDISAAMLERAVAAAPPNVTFHLTGGDSLAPLAGGVADFVLAYQVFQHLPSAAVLQAYLREMMRVAAPGACIAFTTAPCDWRARCLPLLRLRNLLVGGLRGPRDLHRKAWTGIRPSPARLQALCPLPLQRCILPHGRWLYFTRRPSAHSSS